MATSVGGGACEFETGVLVIFCGGIAYPEYVGGTPEPGGEDWPANAL